MTPKYIHKHNNLVNEVNNVSTQFRSGVTNQCIYTETYSDIRSHFVHHPFCLVCAMIWLIMIVVYKMCIHTTLPIIRYAIAIDTINCFSPYATKIDRFSMFPLPH